MTAEQKLERVVRLTPAWDRTDPDPVKNYGVHSVEMHMVLRGEPGAVGFCVYTSWMLPHVHAEYEAQGLPKYQKPCPAEINYHSRKPRHRAYEKPNPACDYMNNAPCYCARLGDAFAPDRLFAILVKEGDEAVWEALRERYAEVFGQA